MRNHEGSMVRTLNLCSCSLVCRRWYRIILPHLFCCVALKDPRHIVATSTSDSITFLKKTVANRNSHPRRSAVQRRGRLVRASKTCPDIVRLLLDSVVLQRVVYLFMDTGWLKRRGHLGHNICVGESHGNDVKYSHCFLI